jgi:hypothetical protein
MAEEIKLDGTTIDRPKIDLVRVRGRLPAVEAFLAKWCEGCPARESFDKTGMIGGRNAEYVCGAARGIDRKCGVSR